MLTRVGEITAVDFFDIILLYYLGGHVGSPKMLFVKQCCC